MNRTPDVEDTLRRTLRQAAGQAPGLPAEAAASQVEARYRRRRQRRQALLAGAAVVVIAGGVAGGLRAADRAADRAATVTPDATATAAVSPPVSPAVSPPVSPPVSPAQSHAPSYDVKPEPIGSVWPEALREVPAKTPDGKKIQPILLLDDRTLLVSTWASFEKTDALYAYDLDTLALREITHVVTPEGTVLFASGFDAAGGHVAWWTQLKDGTAQIWAAPLTGGEARVIGSRELDERGVDKVEIVGDRVAFSARSGGVFTVPLGGGEVEPVANGAGMHLLSWPWIGTPGPYGAGEGTRYGLIRNLRTGETDRALVRDGERVHACGVTLCVGSSGAAPFHRMRDGSQQQELPGGMARTPPALDRFHVASVRYGRHAGGVALFDLRTGASADLGIPSKRTAGGFSLMRPGFDDDGRLLAYPVGDTLRVIDVTKIK
ncbi:TolB family protein [Nonomuraea harbinensis]|uniref:TolB family protein n=1 Tax=Nonomuraea harbinensis TaxID=1286938 RepID=A0ABW1BX49_9ACTN|nr:hypothetical protein [Nonomuraea harbinensis]